MRLTGNLFNGALIICGCYVGSSQALELGKFGETDVSLTGYVKFDAMMTDFSDGDIGPESLAREFYLPSATPVGGESESSKLDFHARQTRFGIKTNTDLEGDKLTTFIEMDFMATEGGQERTTNSRVPRLRHAFLQYNNWLFGQTWSTFMDVSALPETLDFIGNTDATIFVRQAQIRYTNGPFQFAIENPETSVTPFGGGDLITTDDNSLPDMVARYNFDAGNFKMSVAALARQLQYENGAVDDTESALGFSISGVLKIGEDDLKFLVNTGSGIGRYVALNTAAGAVLNAAGELEAIDTTAYYVSYRHHWSDQWRSTISHSAITIDNDTDLTGLGVTDQTNSTRINLIYSPHSRLSFGGELSQATREVESGASGDMNRLQFSATLTF